MHRVFLLLTLVALAGSCREQVPQLPHANPPAASTEDLAVYAAVIDSLYSRDSRVDTILVHEFAVAVPSRMEEDRSTEAVLARLDRLRGAPRDAIRDFISANSSDAAITSPLPIARPMRLTPPDSIGPLKGRPAPYSFEFSRVGYSASRDFALVMVSFHCIICGEGQSVLLKRGPNGWRVVEASVDWVS